jgi:hypothetical protein
VRECRPQQVSNKVLKIKKAQLKLRKINWQSR